MGEISGRVRLRNDRLPRAKATHTAALMATNSVTATPIEVAAEDRDWLEAKTNGAATPLRASHTDHAAGLSLVRGQYRMTCGNQTKPMARAAIVVMVDSADRTLVGRPKAERIATATLDATNQPRTITFVTVIAVRVVVHMPRILLWGLLRRRVSGDGLNDRISFSYNGFLSQAADTLPG